MLSENLKSKELYSFVTENLGSNPNDLLMKYAGKNSGFDLKFAVTQIANRKKTGKKIPSFLRHEGFLFPDLVSAEQASDERVARFHASLIGSGKKVIDLTAGLGIDALMIAQHGNRVIGIEIDSMKADVLDYNAKVLGLQNFMVVNEDCENYIKFSSQIDIDYYFIDPARRDKFQKRTYAFSDCKPDVTALYKDIIENGSTLLIKASPLLDIEAVKHQLENIIHIYAISVKGECKELLIELSKRESDSMTVTAVDLDDDGIKSEFSIKGEDDKTNLIFSDYDEIMGGGFLYEPNASVMKLKAGGELCKRFQNMKKISKSTELFFSRVRYPDFPGRIIEIKRMLSSRDLKSLKGEKRSVVVRNYPVKAEELKKKIGLGEDPVMFIYGFRIGEKEKPVIIEGKKIEV